MLLVKTPTTAEKLISLTLNNKTMKKLILLLSLIVLLVSCKKSSNEEECQYNNNIASPEPYKLETRGEITFNGSVQSFQFVNENIGYAMCRKNVGSYVELFKTKDGGRSWENLEIGIKQYPVGFAFKNEQIGIITVHDVAGCPPPGCLNKCVYYKTENGGKSWSKIELEQYKGLLYYPQFDNDGNLYAYLSMIDSQASIVKSTDNGTTWSTLFTSPDLGFTIIHFSFNLADNKIYTATKNGDLLVLSNSGTQIKTITMGATSGISDLVVINENNLISVNSNKTIKTNDGGQEWQTIHDKNARIIGFNDENEGLMILQKNYCGSSGAIESNDYIAYTKNGGKDWVLPYQTSVDLVSSFNGSQEIGSKHWYIMVGNKLMNLKSQ